MSFRVSRGGVAAQVDGFGCMVTPSFTLNGGVVSPMYVAPWDGYTGEPLLANLRGDFVCVPFGIAPDSMADFPPGWRELEPGITPHPHGYAANSVWATERVDQSSAELVLEYPPEDVVEVVRRTVTCEEQSVVIEDQITVRRDVALPLGLHPIFRLPHEAGGVRLDLPGCEVLATLPVATDASSILRPMALFADARAAPLREGGAVDLTRLPLAQTTEELVLLCNVAEPRVSIENEIEGYRVVLEWESEHLRHCLLWISNKGRSFPPWNGRNLCLGVEPVTSAFDLGPAVSAADNPLAVRGIPTAVPLAAGRTLSLRHSLRLEPLV